MSQELDLFYSSGDLLRAIMQLDAQFWNDLLWLSGGLLELSKCSFHHIHFDFMPNGTAIMRADKFGAPLQVHDELTNNLVTIPAKSVFQSHKTLGHHEAPGGANTMQLKVLQLCSDANAKMVSTSSCDHMDSWFFYKSIYTTSLGYVLPNCFFSKQDLTKVQLAALRAFLSKFVLAAAGSFIYTSFKAKARYCHSSNTGAPIPMPVGSSALPSHGLNFTSAPASVFSKTPPQLFRTYLADG
jgi:hypothetical protein